MANMKLSSCILVLFLCVVSISGDDITTTTLQPRQDSSTTSKAMHIVSEILNNILPPGVYNTTSNVDNTKSNSTIILTANPLDKTMVESDVHFYLYFRNSSIEIQYLNDNSIIDSPLTNDKPVKVLVHGDNDNYASNFNQLITAAFLKSEDLNVIIVDWSLGITEGLSAANSNVSIVGRLLAKFIDWLHNVHNIPIQSFHLIGHDLGAHVVGIAGQNVKGGKITYITALDPVAEYKTHPINPSDADYVEGIHTAIIRSGLEYPFGHADFYPNKGFTQPGCQSDDVDCSHKRAYELFAESINNTEFQAEQCSNFAEMEDNKCANLSISYMGGSEPKYASGVFYLETTAEKPYYIGKSQKNG